MDYSISLNGIMNAEKSIDQSARRLATIQAPDLNRPPTDSLSLTDIAKEFVSIDQAKIAYKANLKVMATGQELENDILNILG
jgi:hypothetical protein